MNATAQLRKIGQSIWLDNISRHMIDSGELAEYIEKFSVTGLTSNPSIFGKSIAAGADYDAQINSESHAGASTNDVLLQLMVEDLRRAADLFAPIHAATGGNDGWVSIEVSPHLIDDAEGTLRAAARLHDLMARPNAFVKIPGTKEGVKAIEEAIFRGIPINVTLLFSRAQYEAVSDAYLRGIERRISQGLDPRVRSVASVFVSRWDVAIAAGVHPHLRNRLGLAVAADVWDAYQDVNRSERFRAVQAAGAIGQTLLWASTGVKDPQADSTMYVAGLAAPDTIDTMPEATLRAFADHGQLSSPLALNDNPIRLALGQAQAEGIDLDAMALQLQRQGGAAFSGAWDELCRRIEEKT